MGRADVDAALRRLVDDGVVTAAQADAVREAVARERESSGVHPAAEAAAWVGAVLAAAAGVTAAAAFWAELTRWAQSGILLLAAVALFAAGQVVRDDARPAARRILSVVWFLAVAALGGATVVAFADEPLGVRALPWTVAGVVATAAAVPLWRVHPSAPQLTAVAASALATVLAALGLAERPPVDLYGLVVWAVGAALVLLAWGGLAVPRGAGRLLGALTALAGAQGLMFAYPRAGVLLALATVAGVFALAGLLDHVALTGLGAIALAVFVPQALQAFFPDSLNASATLFLSGVALLAGALATIRRARDATPVSEESEQGAQR